MIRYGTIGTGWITDSFINGAKLTKGLMLSAVCSRDYEKGKAFAETHGAKIVFTDYREMAKSKEIDAVYIASPNGLHYEQSRLFLQHGKNVICEKPATILPEEFAELQMLARKNNVVYMEAIMMLHLPQRQKLKAALSRIGNVTTARFDFSQLSSKYTDLLSGKLPNIFNPKFSTGCLMDLGIYCVYLSVDLFGVPEKVLASAGFLSSGADGYDHIVFVYPDKQLVISCSKIGQSRIGSEILGDRGTLSIASVSKLTGITLTTADGESESIVGEIEKSVLMSGEAADFYRYITDPKKSHAEYETVNQLTLTVNQILSQIRAKVGISFQ